MNEKHVTEEQVHEACATIVANRDKKALNYAVNYAQLARHMVGHELYVQILYVLSNIQYWRGGESKATRDVLKQYVKEYKGRDNI